MSRPLHLVVAFGLLAAVAGVTAQDVDRRAAPGEPRARAMTGPARAAAPPLNPAVPCDLESVVAKYRVSDLAAAARAAEGYQVDWLYQPQLVSAVERQMVETVDGQQPGGGKQQRQDERPPLRRRETPDPRQGATRDPRQGVAQAPRQAAAAEQATATDRLLIDELRRSYVLASPGRPIGAEEIRRLEAAGFSEIELNCEIGALQAPGRTTPATRPPSATIAANQPYWHLTRTGAATVAPFIQRTVGRLERPVRVAVIDSGIDPRLEPLPDGWSFELERGVPASSTPWLKDGLGHGTAVAWLVRELAGPLAELMSIKVLDENGRGTQAALANGLLEAVARDARIINLSLGYYKRGVPGGYLPDFLAEALAAAHASGARVYAAAGNTCLGPDREECNAFYPAAASWIEGRYTLGVTSVSGLNPRGRASTQVVTAPVDIWAPSEFVCTHAVGQTARGEERLRLSGSSFAAPQLTGSLALLIAFREHQLKRALSEGEIDALQTTLLRTAAQDAVPAAVTWSHRGTVLDGRPGGRLDLCATMAALGSPVRGCTTWKAGAADPSVQACGGDQATAEQQATYDDSASDKLQCCGYPVSTGYELRSASGRTSGGPPPVPLAVEQVRAGTWCSETVQSAPSVPICASCEYCITSSNLGRFELTLRLTQSASFYESFQLKVEQNGAFFYYPLPGLSDSAGQTVTFTGTFSPPLSGVPDEVWLVAREQTLLHWSGVPLMRRNNCN